MTMTKSQGTPLYMAPEILCSQKRYSKAIDVYSYGILMACVWNNGLAPYAEYNSIPFLHSFCVCFRGSNVDKELS